LVSYKVMLQKEFTYANIVRMSINDVLV